MLTTLFPGKRRSGIGLSLVKSLVEMHKERHRYTGEEREASLL